MPIEYLQVFSIKKAAGTIMQNNFIHDCICRKIIPVLLFPLHLPPVPSIVKEHEHAAQNPSCGIGKSHRIQCMDKPGDCKQIQLAEDHEAAQHDDHGAGGVAGAPEYAGMNLIEAAAYIKRRHEAQENTAVIQDVGLTGEQPDERRGGQIDENGQGNGDCQRDAQGRFHALFNPLLIACSQILAGEGGGGHGQTLHGQDDQLIDLGVGGPARHAGGTEPVDVGLHKYIGK